ncbi:MAG: hypothetical protein ACLRSY_01420 [Acutalibacter sp.]
MLEIQSGRFVLKSRESLHGRELDVVVDSLTGVNYVTYLASSSAPLSPCWIRTASHWWTNCP